MVVKFLRCKGYKGGDVYQVPYYETLWNLLTHLYELWWKVLHSYNSYWDFDDDYYTRGRPYDLN